MRKALFASAALAALAIAGAVSAQSVTVNGSYLHNASGSPQVSSLNLTGITVGTNLNGAATSVGTSLNVAAADNIFVPGRVQQLNTSGQIANANLSGNIGSDTTFTATAGGNAASFSADDSLNISGLRQSNTAAQTANVGITNVRASGDFNGGATAFGNSTFGESVYGGVDVANGVQFQQSNVGNQTANTTVGGGAPNFYYGPASSFGGDTNLRSIAVGGILEFDSAQSGNYNIVQANGRDGDYYGLNGYAGSSQTANLNVGGGSYIYNPGNTSSTFVGNNFNGATSLAATAIGGITNLTAGGNIVASIDTQSHNSAQTSNLMVNGASFGSLTGSAQSIGTSVSINTRP